MIYDQVWHDTLYIMLYTLVTAMAVMASCYMLFRQGNAFAKDITPPACSDYQCRQANVH